MRWPYCQGAHCTPYYIVKVYFQSIDNLTDSGKYKLLTL